MRNEFVYSLTVTTQQEAENFIKRYFPRAAGITEDDCTYWREENPFVSSPPCTVALSWAEPSGIAILVLQEPGVSGFLRQFFDRAPLCLYKGVTCHGFETALLHQIRDEELEGAHPDLVPWMLRTNGSTSAVLLLAVDEVEAFKVDPSFLFLALSIEEFETARIAHQEHRSRLRSI